MDSSALRLFHAVAIAYDEDIESRMLQKNNNKDQHRDESGTTGVIPKRQIRKTPTGCRGFFMHENEGQCALMRF